MIGISYHSGGFADKPLSWVVQHLAETGYDAIEIVCGPEAHIRTGDPLGPQLDAAKALLSRWGLKVAAINPYTQPSMVVFAQQDYAETVRRWSLLVDIAVALGSQVVNFLAGWLAEGDRVAWELLIRVLRDLAPHAERNGVHLAVHNHEGNIIDSPDKCLNLIAQVGSPNLRVLCDITNFYILGGDVDLSVQRLGPHIVHCHDKGCVGKYPYNRFIVPGEEGDELPFDDFARALGSVGYEGCISVETFQFMRQDKAKIAYEMMSARLRKLGLRD